MPSHAFVHALEGHWRISYLSSPQLSLRRNGRAAMRTKIERSDGITNYMMD